MITTIALTPGVTLRHCPDHRFKKSAMSIQLLRPMDADEAANNALLPAVLLRGTRAHPDLRWITWRLDELYGASVQTMVRRIGQIQTVGFYLSILDDRFALDGEAVLAGGVDFLRELLLEPLTEGEAFVPQIVESEKRNLISAIESELNDKRAYAASQMLRKMCQGDSFGLSRLGQPEQVAAITPESLYAHYRMILRRSPVEIFYVGSQTVQQVTQLVMPLAKHLGAEAQTMPQQCPLVPQTQAGEWFETMDLSQGKLSMGFTTPITNRHEDFVAMQVFNALYGGGITSKLFSQVRERMGLCYDASSGYYSTKGIVTVSCGIDEAQYVRAKDEILHQLALCAQGQITQQEIEGAKAAVISSLRATPDSPGALEGYYATAAISGTELDIPEYIRRVEQVTIQDVARCAGTVKLHTVYFLKGETP